MGVLRAHHGDSIRWRHHPLAFLTQGQLPSPRGPPRHHRTKLEGTISLSSTAPSTMQPSGKLMLLSVAPQARHHPWLRSISRCYSRLPQARQPPLTPAQSTLQYQLLESTDWTPQKHWHRPLIVACGMLLHSSSMAVQSFWILAGTGTRCCIRRSRASQNAQWVTCPVSMLAMQELGCFQLPGIVGPCIIMLQHEVMFVD